jgi:hypothetical protein
MTNHLQCDGYNDLMNEIRLSWDSGDPFGSVQEWRLALCEVLAFDYDLWVPDFRTCATEPEPDNYAVEAIRSSFADTDDMQTVLTVLDRFREWLRPEIFDREY